MSSAIPSGGGGGGGDAKSVASSKRCDLQSLVPQSKLETSIFNVSLLISQQIKDRNPFWTWVFTIVEDLQLLSFSLSTSLHPGLPTPVSLGLTLYLVPDSSNYTQYRFADGILVIILLATFALFGLAVVLMHTRTQVPTPFIWLLAHLHCALSTVLVIPTTQLLVTGLNCFNNGLLPGSMVECTSPTHVPFLVFNALVLVVYAPLAVGGLLLVLDASPSSTHPLAQPFGKVDARGKAARIAIAIAKVLLADLPSEGFKIAFLAFTLVGLGWMAVGLIHNQPYYDERMTHLRSAFAVGAMLAVATTLLVRIGVEGDPADWWILVLPTTLLGCILGALASHNAAKRQVIRTIALWKTLRPNSAITENLTMPAPSPTVGDASGPSKTLERCPFYNTPTVSQLMNPPPKVVPIPFPTIQTDTGTGTASRVLLYSSNPIAPPSPPTPRSGRVTRSDTFVPSSSRTSTPMGSSIIKPPSDNKSRSAQQLSSSARPPPRASSPPLAVAPDPNAMATRILQSLRQQGRRRSSIDSRARFPLLSEPPVMDSPYSTISPQPAHQQRRTSDSILGTSSTIVDPGHRTANATLSLVSHIVNPQVRDAHSHHQHKCTKAGDLTGQRIHKSPSIDTLTAVLEHRTPPRTNVFDSPSHVEVTIRFVRTYPTTKQLTVGFQLLERGLAEFPNDPHLLLVAIAYLSEFYGAEGQQAADLILRTLRETKCQRDMPLDLRYLLFVQDKRMAMAVTLGQMQGGGVRDRSAALDPRLKLVKRLHLMGLVMLRDVWEAIRQGSGVGVMSEAIARLAEYQASVEDGYQKLLARYPKEKQLLRAYASWLYWGQANQVAAAAVLDVAEEVETLESRVQAVAVPPSIPPSPTSQQVYELGQPTHSWDPPIKPAGAVAKKAIALGILSGHKHDDPYAEHGANLTLGNSVNFRSAGSLEQHQFSGVIQPPPPLESHDSFATSGTGGGGHDPITGAPLTGSQTSGTSAARTQRKKTALRKRVGQAIEEPLNQTRSLALSWLVFVGSVVVGFVLCHNLYFKTTRFLATEFAVARDVRRECRSIIENTRLMTFESLPTGTRRGFSTALNATRKATTSLLRDFLPTLVRSYQQLPRDVIPTRRVFLKRVVNNVTDFQPLLATPMDAVDLIAQAGAIASGFPSTSSLLPPMYDTIPELGVLVHHLPELLDMSGMFRSMFFGEYQEALRNDLSLLLVSGCVSLGLLAAGMGVVYWVVLGRYFEGERRVMRMLMKVPKRDAGEIVTSLEEEIENMVELTEGEDGGNDSLDLHMSSSASSSPSTAKSTKQSAGRMKRIVAQLVAFAFALSVLIFAMYFFTYMSLDQEDEMRRMALSADRRMQAALIRLYAREWMSDPMFPSGLQVQRLRGVIADLVSVHALLVNDMGGFGDQLPHLTTLPRTCATAAACGVSGPLNATLGYTLESAQLPLNLAITRLAELATDVVGGMVMYKSPDVFVTTSYFGKFQVLIYLCADMLTRLALLDTGVQDMMAARVSNGATGTVIVFALYLGAVTVGLGVGSVVVLARLKREARALAVVPYLVPPAVVSGVKGLNALLESGGATLRVADGAAAGEEEH
ncbi:hypothetical protein BCR44DRAFT_51557 [Catenaria anguillulae PL171]|uniref:TmcB/TmcC TPR repeats domain-containing protein n=1 Tax=Catenaria anguillulae PL171 TaxID=765915 RepID=A0A1Y2HP47_9FUNG|nr:hypothetical protein BCR44DRAFT_51557 [Catenaria anguillulae PL171]